MTTWNDTTPPIIPENGRPLVQYPLEPGHAALWAPSPGSVADDVTLIPIPVTIVRFTSCFVVLGLPSGEEKRIKIRNGSWALFFRGWCPACETPACTAEHDAAAMVCRSCGAVCEGLPPANVFLATVREGDLNLARRYRLMVERGWTKGQAWERVHGPLRGPNRLGDAIRAWMAGDTEAYTRIGEEQSAWWDQARAALDLPLPPVSPFDQELPPLINTRPADDCEPDTEHDTPIDLWLAQQFRRAA